MNNFKDAAEKVHGIRYDYNQSVPTGITKALVIVCPEHGEFTRTPNAHINFGLGCPVCGDSPVVEKEPEEKLTYVLEASGFDKLFNKDRESL